MKEHSKCLDKMLKLQGSNPASKTLGKLSVSLVSIQKVKAI